MTELIPGKLARPLDRAAMSNDVGVLKSLLGMLNNPLITGAEPPTTPEAERTPPVAPPVVAVATPEPLPEDLLVPSPSPLPEAQPSRPKGLVLNLPAGCRDIFFTGASKAGKSWLAASLGARVLEFADPIAGMIRDVFPDARDTVALQKEIFAWGDGQVSPKYPLTASRMHFVASVRMMSNKTGLFGIGLETFGTAGFWAESLIARAKLFHEDCPNDLLVVTDVWEPGQYSALRDSGFAPFHVMCNNVTRSGRGGSSSVSPMVNGIERDITNRISQQPRGKKLWVVWCDSQYPPTSPRMLTVQEFIDGVSL